MAAAAAAKPPVSRSSMAGWLLLLVAVAAMQTTRSSAQSCMSELSNLNVCAPFVLPGASGSPSPDCCNALQSVQHDCLCSTLRIASRLPSVCNLPPFSCTR
ncbi:hypothetical protein Nepgr_029987 [Nepenthes gracilis]|uniref:Bifunctional inhibitor/plant lipid transfer protein/seed storage helical domain-containing protein n=1 Tax=Nepenthes gracilis TaxID=150966 RepID=A0AAD3TFF0_NEPGR|nr:hypothetical protein Nepgr_029987 [Nepenthes gracilis]